MRIPRRKFIEKSLAFGAGGYLALRSWNRCYANGAELGYSPYLIIVHCDGGWDPTMVFDDKNKSTYIDTQSGQTSVGEKGKISYVAHKDRPSVDTFFSDHGAKSCIVNGIYCGSMGHSDALRYTSGVVLPKTNRFNDWGSFYAAQAGLDMPCPHLVINAPYLPGTFAKYTTLLTSERIEEFRTAGACPVSQYSSTGDVSERALDAYLGTSYQGLLENRLNDSLDSEKVQTFAAGYSRATSICNLVARAEFAAGDSDFQKQCKLAVKLISGGHAFVATLQAGSKGAWDTHANHFSAQNDLYEDLFSGLNTLIAEAKAAGIADRLTIVVKSEMGRDPKINSLSKLGKDHWPFTSALLWGAGINGGVVIGQTDDRLRGIPINPTFGTTDDVGVVPMEMRHIVAALLNLFGVPPTLLLPDTPLASIILSLEGA